MLVAWLDFGAAIDYLQGIGYASIQQWEEELLRYAREKLGALPFMTLYMPREITHHSSVISMNMNGVHPHDVASLLDQEGVCVRSGNHCAQPLLRYMGLDSTCRASFAFYNTMDEVDRFLNVLKGIRSRMGL